MQPREIKCAKDQLHFIKCAKDQLHFIKCVKNRSHNGRATCSHRWLCEEPLAPCKRHLQPQPVFTDLNTLAAYSCIFLPTRGLLRTLARGGCGSAVPAVKMRVRGLHLRCGRIASTAEYHASRVDIARGSGGGSGGSGGAPPPAWRSC